MSLDDGILIFRAKDQPRWGETQGKFVYMRWRWCIRVYSKKRIAYEYRDLVHHLATAIDRAMLVHNGVSAIRIDVHGKTYTFLPHKGFKFQLVKEWVDQQLKMEKKP